MNPKYLYLALACLAVTACDESDSGVNAVVDPGPYHLTFALDASFQAPHGDQPIRIALVRLSDGNVIAQDSGIVSATEDPSFSFRPGDLLELGTSYAVHYWIDSNIGGGTPGVCDPATIDHQWSVEFFSVANEINFTTAYDANLTEFVCNTFL